jgi:hypothetical protein
MRRVTRSCSSAKASSLVRSALRPAGRIHFMGRIDDQLIIHGDPHEKLALSPTKLGDVEVEEADGVVLKGALRRVSFHFA